MGRSLECDVVAVALQILASGFAAGAVYGLVAAGHSIVFRLTGVVNLAFGVVSRAAPSLNLFAVGFPVSLVVGLLVVLAGIAPLQESFTGLLAQGFEFLRSLLHVGAR